MTRDEFMYAVYDELESDGTNERANRIIEIADEYAETYAEEDLNDENEQHKLSNDILTQCPFCGGTAEFMRDYKGNRAGAITDGFHIICKDCGAKTNVFSSNVYLDNYGNIVVKQNGAKRAAEAWNKRS